ncbi:MAG TPA: hypothetical protein VHS58_11220 [Acetobacteraceae bacterium]|nr:hypothetical protein [Acetobacteraceae bacterium]
MTRSTVLAGLALAGIGGCTTSAPQGAAEAAPLTGVIAATRPIPPGSPALAAAVSSVGGMRAPAAAASVELVVQVDGGGALSVVQRDGARFAAGQRVRVTMGPPSRVDPAP